MAMIFNEKRKFSGKSIVFSTNIERTVGYSYDKMDFNLHLRLIKLSKKRFIDLNVKLK